MGGAFGGVEDFSGSVAAPPRLVLVIVLENYTSPEDDYEHEAEFFDHAGQVRAKDIAMEKGRGLDKVPARERIDE